MPPRLAVVALAHEALSWSRRCHHRCRIGIGRALAVDLARRGNALALSDVSETGLAETRMQAEQAGASKVTTEIVDVANRESVEAWAAATEEAHGRVHLLFNNAGVSLTANLSRVT